MKKSVFILLLFMLIVSIVLTGCFKDSKEAETPETNQVAESGTNDPVVEEPAPGDVDSGKVTFKQSPVLEGQGLPPVAERLPMEPKITNEMDPSQLNYEVGRYGGTLRMTSAVPDYNADIFVMMNEGLLNTPGLLGEEITGNVVKGYEMSDDQKVFTFFMREGLKWSDGTPVTTEDVLFTYEDVLMNEELTPTFPSKYRAGGKPNGDPFELEVLDEYSFKMSFSEPYGGLLMRMAIQGWVSYTDLLKPKHYLQPFHIKYADENELAAKVKEGGFEQGEWYNLFNDVDIVSTEATNRKALGFPTLNPWHLIAAEQDKFVLERNPYYFKVDLEGNQLPYIDNIESLLTQDTEMVNLKIISGEIDFTRESASLVKIAMYKENEAKAGFKTILLTTHGRPGGVFINQTFDNPVWREVVQNPKFREALNLGMDKEEIIDSIYYGLADLPSRFGSGEFNPDKANQLLDEIGLDKRDANNWRLGSDGKPFELALEVSSRVPETVPESELLVQFWNDLGLKTSMKTLDPTLWNTRIAANEIQISVERMEDYWWQGDIKAHYWAPLWNAWYNSNGAQGEEPPADAKLMLERMSETTSASAEIGYEAYLENQKSNHDNLYFIPAVENAKQPLIVSTRLGNIPEKGTTIAANFAGEQFFFKE